MPKVLNTLYTIPFPHYFELLLQLMGIMSTGLVRPRSRRSETLLPYTGIFVPLEKARAEDTGRRGTNVDRYIVSERFR